MFEIATDLKYCKKISSDFLARNHHTEQSMAGILTHDILKHKIEL